MLAFLFFGCNAFVYTFLCTTFWYTCMYFVYVIDLSNIQLILGIQPNSVIFCTILNLRIAKLNILYDFTILAICSIYLDKYSIYCLRIAQFGNYAELPDHSDN